VGVVVDIDSYRQLAGYLYALQLQHGDTELTLEVAQHLSESSVRAISLGVNSMAWSAVPKLTDTARPYPYPSRDATLGRMFKRYRLTYRRQRWHVQRKVTDPPAPPALIDQSGSVEILETGIKVIDLICPMTRVVRPACFGARRGQDGADSGAYKQYCQVPQWLLCVRRRLGERTREVTTVPRKCKNRTLSKRPAWYLAR